MVLKLKSVSTNPILRLAFKSSLLSYLVLLSQSYGGFWFSAIFVVYFLWFYFKPALNLSKFLFPFLVIFTLILLLPKDDHEIYLVLSVLLGYILGVLIGVKNLVFINRFKVYRHIHWLIFLFVTGFYLYFGQSILNGAVFSILIFNLFKVFYALHPSIHKNDGSLMSALISLISLQMIWVSSIFSLTFFGEMVLVGSFVYIANNIISDNFKKIANYANKKSWRKSLVLFSVVVTIVFIFLGVEAV